MDTGTVHSTSTIESAGRPGRRYAVIGTTGSGKTTMAQRIAEVLGIPHVELDALHWEANWTEAPLELFRQRVDQALAGPAWAVDGNYSRVRDIVWGRADTVVWLDLALPVVLARLFRRTVQRIMTQEELWGVGNREHFRAQFLSRDSLFLWALKTYRRRRKEYPLLFQQPEHAHLQIVRLRSPREAERWLSRLEKCAWQLPDHSLPAT